MKGRGCCCEKFARAWDGGFIWYSYAESCYKITICADNPEDVSITHCPFCGEKLED